jgi:uncharacterized protein with GYD domain
MAETPQQEGSAMPAYLAQVSYTSDAWRTQVGNPQNPLDRVRFVVENLGGQIETIYYAFGDYDIVAIIQFPDNQSAAALSLAAQAGGAIKAYKTTPLMSIDEGLGAMSKAADAGYRPPS